MPEAPSPAHGAQPHATARAASLLTAIAFISPLAGLALEVVLAHRLGASGTVDAFRIASLVLVFSNQLFFGQVLPHVVIPLFTEFQVQGKEGDGWRFATAFAGLLAAAALGLVAWMWWHPEALLHALGPGLTPAAHEEAVLLIRYFSLVFLVQVWTGVMSSILQVHHVFWVQPASQLATNLLTIAAVAAIGTSRGGHAIALGIGAGAVVMLALHVGLLARLAQAQGLGWRTIVGRVPLGTLARAARMTVPLLGMIAISQWSIVVINRTLSLLPAGTLADFGYAWKLLMLVGILPTSLSTVVFPSLSQAQAAEDPTAFQALAARAVRMTLLLTLPLSVVLYASRGALIGLLFAQGEMSAAAIAETGQLFGVLLLSAPGAMLLAILSKISFSLHNTQAPAVAMAVGAVATTWLVPAGAAAWGAAGVAAAYGAVTWLSCIGLLAFLVQRHHILDLRHILRYLAALSTVCVALALALGWLLGTVGQLAPPLAKVPLLMLVMAGLVAGSLVAGLSRALGITETFDILRFAGWQLARFPLMNKLLPRRT